MAQSFPAHAAGSADSLPPLPPPYLTPLAGDPYSTIFMGEELSIPAQNRGHVTALTLGGTFYTPKQGNTAGSPIAALYLKRAGETSRSRSMISIFVNDLEYDRSFGNFELISRFENNTVPGGQEEIVSNKSLTDSSVEWGTIFASIGPGLRYKISPYQIDNDIRLQLLGRIGYFYAKKTDDTSPSYLLPTSTMLYGVKLRGRIDGIRRNILELPHRGVAGGFDIEYIHRYNWNDFGSTASGGHIFKASDTMNYVQSSFYLLGVTPIPGLSERDVILAGIYIGMMDTHQADRYNAFRIGGGPLPGETDDLYRVDYPGTMFNSILVSRYAMTNIEYRRELAFFMYLHLRGSFIWAQQALISSTNGLSSGSRNGQAITTGIDSGFFWDSSLYLDYSWDSGFIRNGKPGNGIILSWNKAF